MTGYRRSAAYAIPLDATGDVTDTDRIRWHHSRNTPYVPSPLLYGQRLYFTKANQALLSCLDARTGKPLMEGVRLPSLRELYASPPGSCGPHLFRRSRRDHRSYQEQTQTGGAGCESAG